MSQASPRRGPGRPAGSEPSEARDALLEAASRLFAAHGVGQVSLRRIGTAAGVTPAMVHYYFGDKAGLYDALLERTFTRLVARVQAALAEGGEDARAPAAPPESDRFAADLANLLEAITQAFAAEPWIPTLIIREVLSEEGRFRERFVRSYASRIAELLPKRIRHAIEAARLRDDLDPELAFLSLMGMTMFPFVARPVLGQVLGLRYDAEFLRRFVAHTQRLFLDGASS